MKPDSSAKDRRDTRGVHAADEIKIDKELAALIPPLTEDERANLEQSLLKEGCREPLIVWKDKNTLLDGHNRYALCRQHNIPFKVKELDLPDRDAAEAFIVKNQLGRRNLSSEAASYLRGKKYLAERQSHGGSRTKAKATDQNDRLETAQRLAAEFKVGEATIRRDGRFALAVDSIAANCGEKAKQAILSRDSRLTRNAAVRLSKTKPKDQQKFFQELLEQGKPPRRSAGRKKSTITLPTEPKSLAEKLLQTLGAKGSSEVLEALAELLKEQKSKE